MPDMTPREPPPLIPAMDIERLRESLHEHAIPEHMHEGVINYVAHGVPPGHFLRAVLENDLKEAVARADYLNELSLAAYVKVLYNDAPGICWGSPATVTQWLRHAADVRQAWRVAQGVEGEAV